MDYLPIFIDAKGRECLIVGGGNVAARKVDTLLRAGAKVRVVAPKLGTAMSDLKDAGKVHHIDATFNASLLGDPILVYAATDSHEVNQAVQQAAKQKNIHVNVTDAPESGTFITPSIIDRSPVVAAVSTAGASPVLARHIRARLETLLPSAYGRLAEFAASYRDKVKAKLSVEKRSKFWECVFKGQIPELVFSGKIEEAGRKLEQGLENADTLLDNQGEVYLIGGGPGDPDLLTFRALRLLQQADVVVHDRLISPAVLDLARYDAKKIYVGKERANHSVPQEGINQILVDLAKSGKRVARLKGGDPFIFGRGGEEIEELVKAGVQFRVVPGITAALGMASYAGIPLTHRDYSQSVVFATGHLKNETTNLNWQALAQPNQTVVFYMGLKGVKTICAKLIEHGMPADTPAALVQKATTVDQKEVIGKLSNLPQLVEAHAVQPPTLIVVGGVVNLHEKLKWFETKHRDEHEPRIF